MKRCLAAVLAVLLFLSTAGQGLAYSNIQGPLFTLGASNYHLYTAGTWTAIDTTAYRVTLTTHAAGTVQITWFGTAGSTGNGSLHFSIFRDGTQLGNASNGMAVTDMPYGGDANNVAIIWNDKPSAGSHYYELWWAIDTGSGFLYSGSDANMLSVTEFY